MGNSTANTCRNESREFEVLQRIWQPSDRLHLPWRHSTPKYTESHSHLSPASSFSSRFIVTSAKVLMTCRNCFSFLLCFASPHVDLTAVDISRDKLCCRRWRRSREVGELCQTRSAQDVGKSARPEKQRKNKSTTQSEEKEQKMSKAITKFFRAQQKKQKKKCFASTT